MAGAFAWFDRDAPPAPITKVEVAPQAPAAASVVVPIYVPLPTAEPAPAVEPEPAPAPEPKPPRATSPFLSVECVDDTAGALECSWDDGFPAISRDGKTIVAKHVPDDGGRGYPGLYLEFIDIATAKTKSVKILDPDEYDGDNHRAKVKRRVASVQKTIDAGAYRSFVAVDETTPLRKEIGYDGQVRVIDDTTSTVLWRTQYAAASAFPDLKHDPEADMCGTVETGDITVWWDAETRTIVTNVAYVFGPSCMCGASSKRYVRRLK